VKVARTVRRGAEGKGPQRYLASRLPDQFTSPQYRDRLAAAGVQISMDGKGRALDNVIIERFWRNLKYDDVYLKGYTTPRAARHGIAAYMHRYNDIRLHEALGYQTPGSVYRGDMPRPDGENDTWG